MKKLVSTILLFNLFIFFISFCIVFIYGVWNNVSFKNFPPPELSDSYSFNDKISFAKNQKADIISIGSSLTLNNISSDVVVNHFKTISYLNLASWGICMEDAFKILQFYYKFHKPKKLIIASNLFDFNSGPKKFNSEELYDFMNSKFSITYHLKHMNLKHYINNFGSNVKVKNGRVFYLPIPYDKYGGQGLDTIRHLKSWNDPCINPIVENSHYVYLDSISKFCLSKNIELYFFQSPTRNSLFNDSNRLITNNHINRIGKILSRKNQFFVNSNNQFWNDYLFVDGIHLNATGAKVFTKYCFEYLKKHIVAK